METVDAVVRLILIVAMLALLAGGLLAILILWYVRGRDPHVGLVADILPEPPDDLSPGAAGTLLDEHADHHDVVATLLGLGRNGVVSITEEREEGARAREFTITLLHPDRVTSPVEHDLLRVLFGPDPQALQEVRLRSVRARFVAAEPRIRDALYDELVARGYFPRSPAQTRRRWRRISWTGLVASLFTGLLVTILVDVFALLPTIAALIVWAVMIRVSRNMPRKTPAGAEAAARWRAFRRYLESLVSRQDLHETAALFDRYLAYAVAFRIERAWIAAFADAGTRTPRWYHPAGMGEAGELLDAAAAGLDMARAAQLLGHLGTPGLDLPDVGAPGMPDVDLQAASDALGGSLQAVSDGFGDLLNAAGSIFDAIDFDLDA